MQLLQLAFALTLVVSPILAQEKKDEGPSSEKAQKSYKEAMDYLHHRRVDSALDAFKKADKQDGGQCPACQRQIVKYALELRDWKAAAAAAEELIAQAKEKKEEAIAHYQLGLVLLEEGGQRRKDEPLHRAHEELGKALAIAPKFPVAILADGRALAFLRQDEDAKARFVQFVEIEKEDSPDRQRAMLYIAQPELARPWLRPFR